jgi:hypothetical protein
MTDSSEKLTPISDAEREIQADIDACRADPGFLETLIDEGTIEATVRLRHAMKGAFGKELDSKVKLWERLLMSRPTDPDSKAKRKKG